MDIRFWLRLAVGWAVLFVCARAQDNVEDEATFTLPPMVVIAERRALGATDDAIELEPSEETLSYGLAELLAEDPSFSLYRREGEFAANPTAQGISLRNIGATATSRTRVLLDGVPQNDPFGGWVYWARFPTASLPFATILPPSQGLPWGQSTAGGVILLESFSPREATPLVDFEIGAPALFNAYARSNFVEGDTAASLELYGREQRGDYRVHPDDRGPIDTRASLSNFGGRSVVEFDDAAGSWRIAGSGYYEDRNNGTPQAVNSSEAWDLSVSRELQPADADWVLTSTVYGQYRNFQNVFTAINAARTTDRPALDQFSVPAWSAGGSATAAIFPRSDLELLVGADGRWITGETNERFRNLGAGFTRQREAGGQQGFLGGFVTARWFRDAFDIEGTLRLDYYRLYDGRRFEDNLTTGQPTLRNTFPDRDDIEPSAQIAVGWQPVDALRLRFSASQNIRVPTINELYRPFRIGNDITEANAALEPERYRMIRLEADAELDERLRYRGAIFQYWIEDAIANVTLTTGGGGVSPVCGFVPAGGSCAQRLNVSDAQVFGIENAVEFDLTDTVELSVRHLFSNASFEGTAGGIDLEGNDFPLAPKHRVSAGAAWQQGNWRAALEARYVASAFEDTNNTREIPDALTVNAGVEARVAENWRLRVDVQNIFDRTVISGVRSDGTRFIAPGRVVSVGLRWEM